METVPCEIITPERVVLRDEAEFVVMPGCEGELGVLPGHARLLALLKPGEVRIVKGGATKRLRIEGGFVHVEPSRVKIVTSAARAE